MKKIVSSKGLAVRRIPKHQRISKGMITPSHKFLFPRGRHCQVQPSSEVLQLDLPEPRRSFLVRQTAIPARPMRQPGWPTGKTALGPCCTYVYIYILLYVDIDTVVFCAFTFCLHIYFAYSFQHFETQGPNFLSRKTDFFMAHTPKQWAHGFLV